jgi:polyisoprenoid-binding protein YceI
MDKQGGFMRQPIQVMFMAISLLMTPVVFAADTYVIDPAHTNFGFTATHMMISKVPGDFEKFSGIITYDPQDLANSKANVSIDVNSINTRIEQRDHHLRSPAFFDVAEYPTITFVSTKFTQGYITGKLTMRGVTKIVTIPVSILGPVKTMGDRQAIGISGSLTVNRQDYGINWNRNLDQGGVFVSNDILLSINIEADKQ